MQLQIEPDLAIPLPVDNLKFSDLKERALAACNTAELLGLDITPTSEDKSDAEKLVYQYAEDGEKTSKAVAKKSHKVTPAAYYEVKNLLDEFSIRVVDNAMQIRLLVTNKLLLDSGNEDPRVRIRALELLGKITDVGLFTEKSEVTINHRSTQDLTTSLREKIRRLMMPEDAQDVEGVEVAGETIDVDKELGISITSEVTPETNSKSDPETPAE
jgi:hypothetical protein